jgi:prepilin-type N-terminal cleavage/methylation domain-containing protein
MTANRQSGFTLLEVLVSLMIFGILMTGLMQGTQFGIQAWSAQTHAEEMHQDLDLVDRTMRHLIGSMDPGSLLGAEKFTGNQRSMGFTAAMPEALSIFGTREADVVVSVSPAHGLILRWAPHYKNPIGPLPAPHVTELVSGVDHIELSYYTAGTPQDQWVTDWQSGGLPSLVRMHIVFPRGDPREWPPIIASVNTY